MNKLGKHIWVHGLTGALIALAGLTHCGGDDDSAGGGGKGGSGAADSGTGGASGGGTGGGIAGDAATDADSGTTSATKTIGPEGGTLTHPDGAELEVPAGALDGPVEFAIVKSPPDAPALSPAISALGSVFAITPHGTAFNQPATVRIPFDAAGVPAGLAASLHSAEEGGKFVPFANTTENAGKLEAQVSSLSYFVSGVPFGYLGEIVPFDVAAYPGGGAAVIGTNTGVFEVVKVNELGVKSWTKPVQGSLWFANTLPRVAVGPTGNVYAATTTENDESGTSLGGGSRVRLMAFNPSGDPRPGFPVFVSLGYDNIIGDVTTDSQDNVYVVGTTAPAGGANHDAYRPFLAVFTESGGVKDPAHLVDMGGTDPGRRIFAHSVAIAPNGSVYMNAQVVGFTVPGSAGTWLIAFDLLGAVAPNYPMELSKSANWSKLAVDQTGIAYVVEHEQQLYAINPNGSAVNGFPKPVELPTTGNFDFPTAGNPIIAVSAVGNLYLTGSVQEHPDVLGDSDAWVQSLDSTGAERAGFPLFLGTLDYELTSAIAVDDAGGNAWVAWYAETIPRSGIL